MVISIESTQFKPVVEAIQTDIWKRLTEKLEFSVEPYAKRLTASIMKYRTLKNEQFRRERTKLEWKEPTNKSGFVDHNRCNQVKGLCVFNHKEADGQSTSVFRP